jgi:hypothetical protein
MTGTDNTSEGLKSGLEVALRMAWFLALIAGALCLYTRFNDFPFYYHPDEPGKIEQLTKAKWNYNHPMLMLRVARCAWQLAGAPQDPQRVVEIGRTVSASFMALAVGALALLARSLFGWTASLITGGLLLFHHQLYELSHYFKEDSALLFGFSAALWGAYALARKEIPLTAAAAGIGLALSISGKYAGVIALPFTAMALIKVSSGNRRSMALWCMGGFVIMWTAVNLPALLHLSEASTSLGREMKLVTSGQGSTTSVPHWRYWNVFLGNTTPVIWPFLLLFCGARIADFRQRSWIELFLSAFPFLFAFLLSFSPKENDRYFLPATAVFMMLGSVAVLDLSRIVAGRVRRGRTELFAGLALIAGQFPGWTDDRGGLLRYDAAFQTDDTARLVEVIRTELPADAVIARDQKVNLPHPEKERVSKRIPPIPQKLIVKEFLPSLGTLEDLRKQGITHVATSETVYGRYFRAGSRPKKGKEKEFFERKQFYSRLQRECPEVWSRERGTIVYLNPGLELYDIREGAEHVKRAPEPEE